MSTRREFTRRQRAEIILRATGADGVIICEGCGMRLGKKPFEIDHILPCALGGEATLDNAQLLGKECCHRGGKTQDDIRRIRKADRQRDKHNGAVKPKRPWHPGFRKKMNGTVERC